MNVKREPGKVIGRVLVDRAIRLTATATADGMRAEVAGTGPGAQAGERDRRTDLRCSGCGAVVCESARMKLFAGMSLQCGRCGQPNRIPR